MSIAAFSYFGCFSALRLHVSHFESPVLLMYRCEFTMNKQRSPSWRVLSPPSCSDCSATMCSV
jgi:hypothetical protein